MSLIPAISIAGLEHWYGNLKALDQVAFDVERREIFGLLGPNGGGKTTLFRLLSTLLPISHGSISLLGHDLAREPAAARRLIGVTFQSPSLDRKLTVVENLKSQGYLYGLSGSVLRNRIDSLLDRLGLVDRARDRVESLSGGLARRVEIAKGLLHDPQVLLLDEPSTGLDPGARIDLWRYLRLLRDDAGVAILVTTHLMDEAERCDRLAILDRGKVVALGTPADLRGSIGGDCLTIQTAIPEELARRMEEQFHVRARVIGSQIRIETETGAELLGRLVDAFRHEISAITLGKPNLEDVFIQRTGHKFWDETVAAESALPRRSQRSHQRNGY